MADLLTARRLLLLVYGASFPSSLLWLHRDAIGLADRAAASA